MKSGMASLNVSMPASLRKLAERRAREGNFATPTEYIRSLIRDDVKRSQRFENALEAGLDSGEPIDAGTEAFWQQRLARLKRRPSQAKKAS